MNMHITRLLLPILGMGLIAVPALRAQDQGSDTNTPSTNAACPVGSCHDGWKHHHGEFANLTEAERQELKADMEQIKGNPQLKSAREAVKQAMENLERILIYLS